MYPDGTAAGTRLLKDIEPGQGESNPIWLTALGREVWFFAGDRRQGLALWHTDGTAARTRPYASGQLDLRVDAPFIASATDRRVFFTGRSSQIGSELWCIGCDE